MAILMIYGSQGVGQEVLWIAERINNISKRWDEIVLIDDYTDKKLINNHRVVKFDEIKYFNKEHLKIVIAVGEPQKRKLLYDKIEKNDFKLQTITYPKFTLSETSQIGPGTIISENAIITVNTKIGCNCLINNGVNVGHDVYIGNHCSLSPGAVVGGFTSIDDNVYIGSGACIRDRIHIGKNSIIGMG